MRARENVHLSAIEWTHRVEVMSASFASNSISGALHIGVPRHLVPAIRDPSQCLRREREGDPDGRVRAAVERVRSGSRADEFDALPDCSGALVDAEFCHVDFDRGA